MKQMNPLRLAVVFSGCFLGAGYVSGQELWQFFGAYGMGGYWGLLPAIALLFVFGVLTLRLVQLTGEKEVDRIVIPWNVPVLRAAVGVLESVFLFGVTAIMSAGTGALVQQLFGIPHYIGGFVFCALVLLVALMGLQGIVRAFSVSVPVLVGVTLIFGIAAVIKGDISAVSREVSSGDNPLLGNWFFSAVIFACYNVFGTIGILTPFGEFLNDRKTVCTGLGLGSFALLLIALSVLISLGLSPEYAEAELPMLALAENSGRIFALIYALLLAFAMFGTALSSFVGLLDYTGRKFPKAVRRRVLCAVVLIAAAYAASLLGFGGLISVLYPVFGYASAVFLVTMLIHYIAVRLGKSRNKSPE